MLPQIERLKIPIDGYSFNVKLEGRVEKSNSINGLRKANFFIGANNSGKSRLLRSIVKSEIEYVPRWLDIAVVQKKLLDAEKRLARELPKDYLEQNGVVALRRRLLELAEKQFVLQRRSLSAELAGLLAANLTQPNSIFGGYNNQRQGNEWDRIAKEIVSTELQLDLQTVVDYFDSKKGRRIYIPIVRSLRRFQDGSDVLVGQFVKEYFPEKIADLEIVTGYDFYGLVKDLQQGDAPERKRLKKYENFLSSTFFEGNKVELVPHRDGVLHIQIGDEQQRPIHELGDGIQALIAMTYKICLEEGTSGIVMIEEPELYLHPGALRVFLEAVLKHNLFTYFQFFFATHSNHLLDLSLDYYETATYSVHKELPPEPSGAITPTFVIEAEDYGSERSLSDLGVRNSSVYLSNCTVWVEGITDRWYLRKYISLIPDEFGFSKYIEDLHYSIVEYAGSNLTHWSFIQEKEEHPINVAYLCGKAFVVMDSDDRPYKKKNQENVRKVVKDRLFVLPVREIENLLMPEILKKTVKDYALTNEDISAWNGFQYSDYHDVRLAKFVDDGISIKHKFAGEYDVLTGKKVFCTRALSHIATWNDMSEDAKTLALKVMDFVKEHNR